SPLWHGRLSHASPLNRTDEAPVPLFCLIVNPLRPFNNIVMDPYYPQDQYLPPRRSNYSPLIVLLLIGIGALLVWHFFFNHGTPAVDPRPVAPRGDLAGDEKSTIDLFREAGTSGVFITSAQRVEFWNRRQE